MLRLRDKALPLLILTAVLLVAAGLRFHLLGAQSLWNDEGSSYVQALRPFAEIAANAGRDIHPPGYYWLLAGWRLLTGTSEFALRSLSALASVLSIAFAAALGRRLYGWAAGITAAILIALNTFASTTRRKRACTRCWRCGRRRAWALAGLLQRKMRWALALGLFNAAGLWTVRLPVRDAGAGRSRIGVGGDKPQLVPFHAASLTVERGNGAERDGGEVSRTLLLYVAANVLAILQLHLPWLPTALHQITTWPNTGTRRRSRKPSIRCWRG
ncbi:MAG: glycosyltransferase family 39 protein [Anaerolineae bacterium]